MVLLLILVALASLKMPTYRLPRPSTHDQVYSSGLPTEFLLLPCCTDTMRSGSKLHLAPHWPDQS